MNGAISRASLGCEGVFEGIKGASKASTAAKDAPKASKIVACPRAMGATEGFEVAKLCILCADCLQSSVSKVFILKALHVCLHP